MKHSAETKVAFWLFVLLMAVYLLSARGHVQILDSHPSLATAHALVDYQSLAVRVTDGKFWDGWGVWGCLEGRNGGLYSIHGIGLAFLWVPVVLLGKGLAGIMGVSRIFMTELLISFFNVFFGVGACLLMFRLSLFFKASIKTSCMMALLLGLATSCWHYSVSDFSEVTQMCLLLLAVYCILKNTSASFLDCVFLSPSFLFTSPFFASVSYLG